MALSTGLTCLITMEVLTQLYLPYTTLLHRHSCTLLVNNTSCEYSLRRLLLASGSALYESTLLYSKVKNRNNIFLFTISMDHSMMRSFNHTTRQCDDSCFTPGKMTYRLVMRSRRPPDTTAWGNLGVMVPVSKLYVLKPIFVHVVMSTVINTTTIPF